MTPHQLPAEDPHCQAGGPGAAAPFLSSQPQLGFTKVFLLCSMVCVNYLLVNVIRAFPGELLPPTLHSHHVFEACVCNQCSFCFNASQHQRSAHLHGSASAAVPACPVLPVAMRPLWPRPHLPHSSASPQFCPHTWSTVAPECLAGLLLMNSDPGDHIEGCWGCFGLHVAAPKQRCLCFVKLLENLLKRPVFCFPPQKPESKPSATCPVG